MGNRNWRMIIRMRAAVIGYNIFAIGGTTQSNLNLLSVLNQYYDETIYFNYLPFNSKDVLRLKKKNDDLLKTKFQQVRDLFDKDSHLPEMDLIFITRESLFPLSVILRATNTHALIVGEVHTPLALLNNSLSGLKDLSCVRVATNSVRDAFEKRYHFKRVYVQNVSLAHLRWKQRDQKSSHNFVIQSRFFEKQKDIMYSLRLFNALKQDGNTNYHLYINGTGQDEFEYRSYIDGNHLRSMVSINHRLPRYYTYLSTSKFETFGYSIAEAVANGHQVLAYLGDDDVVYENFKNVPMVHWMEKRNLNDDTQKLISLSQHVVTITEFEQSHRTLNKMADEYYQKFQKRTEVFKKLIFKCHSLNNGDYEKVQQSIESDLGPINPNLIRRCYYRIIKAPLFKQIFGLRVFQRLKQKMK